MTPIITSPVELRQRGFEALVASLGWVNAVRFLQQYEVSQHDYTREREQILPDWDAETLVRLAKQPAKSQQ
ncbi:MAG: hypothetical protein ACREHD_04465 [Pirellulales bacterium]